MAYNGYLIRVGGTGGGTGTMIPMKYIKLSGYTITPDQRMETEAKRDVTGVLHRKTVAHTATKIEFTTPPMTNLEMDDLMSILRNAWTNVNERRIRVRYYDMEINDYKTSEFYMPDVKFQIDRIDNVLDIVYYKEARFAFIEY